MVVIVATQAASVMPGTEHICWRPCSHLRCVNVRRQRVLPCCGCQRAIPTGSDLYILDREDDGAIKRQMCAGCYRADRTR